MTNLQWPDKDPTDVWDYTLDASSWVAAVGDTLASCTATVSPSGLSILSTATTPAGQALVRLSGGAVGIEYRVTLTLTTTGGRILQRSVEILVRDQ